MKHPNNLDEAIAILTEEYSKKPEQLKAFRDAESSGIFHHGFGTFIRNSWHLWEQETPIVKWFKKTYRIEHGDDISSIILDSWYCDLNGWPRRDAELAEEKLAYWRQMKDFERRGVTSHTFKVENLPRGRTKVTFYESDSN